MKPQLIMFAALIVVMAAVSGCTTTAGSSGLLITSFQPSFSEVYSGEPVDFKVQLENAGTVDAEYVSAKIIGLDSWDFEFDTCYGWDRIAGQTPSIGAPGESRNCYWQYTAPDIPTGLRTKYNPTARVFYEYRTSLVESIIIASSDEMVLMKERGTPVPAQSRSQTSGPLSIDIVTEAPIRVWEGSVEFPVSIKITNIGGGIVCPDVSDCENGDNINTLSLDVESDSDIRITECDYDEVKLWEGKTNTMLCRAIFNMYGNIDTQQRTIRVNANYGYYVDRSTEVSVTKR